MVSFGFYGVSEVINLYYQGILGVPWISMGFPGVLRGGSWILMSPQGYQEFEFFIFRVSLRFLWILWCIKSYKSVLFRHLWGSLGYPWGILGVPRGDPCTLMRPPRVLIVIKFYNWGSLGFLGVSLGFLRVKRRAAF